MTSKTFLRTRPKAIPPSEIARDYRPERDRFPDDLRLPCDYEEGDGLWE